MAQLNFPVSDNRFINVTYQSNNYLNEELDNKVKQEIAKVIVASAVIKNIHSYIHGQIIVEVANKSVVSTLKKLTKALAKPMAAHTPSLFYSVDLVSFVKGTEPLENLIYVDGDNQMNSNFLKSIEEYWPYPKAALE